MPEMQVTKLKPRKLVKGQSAKKLMLEWNGEPNVGVVDHGQASQVTKEIGESSQQASQTMTQRSVFADSFYAASDPYLADSDFVPFLDLDTLDDANREIPQSVRKGKGGLETVYEDKIVIGGVNEIETNNVTNVEEGSDSKEGNADKLGVEDKEGEFNANEEIDVDLDVIDNKEFESASDKDGLERVRQRKLKHPNSGSHSKSVAGNPKLRKGEHNQYPWTLHVSKLEIMDQIESNQEVPIKAIQDQLQKKYQVEVSRMKAFRAKSKVVDQ
ncbi:hypothetical protein Tco_1513936, partial [Tanacetum coccineum]